MESSFSNIICVNSMNVLEFTVSESYDFRTFYGLVLVIAYYLFFFLKYRIHYSHIKIFFYSQFRVFRTIFIQGYKILKLNNIRQ